MIRSRTHRLPPGDGCANPMDENDLRLLRAALDLARAARQHGNHPFGALLADEQGNILLRAENTVVTARDSTGHAEANLMREASKTFAPERLARCTIYTSTEPCPMCAGAIFWGNVRRVEVLGPALEEEARQVHEEFWRGER